MKQSARKSYALAALLLFAVASLIISTLWIFSLHGVLLLAIFILSAFLFYASFALLMKAVFGKKAMQRNDAYTIIDAITDLVK